MIFHLLIAKLCAFSSSKSVRGRENLQLLTALSLGRETREGGGVCVALGRQVRWAVSQGWRFFAAFHSWLESTRVAAHRCPALSPQSLFWGQQRAEEPSWPCAIHRHRRGGEQCSGPERLRSSVHSFAHSLTRSCFVTQTGLCLGQIYEGLLTVWPPVPFSRKRCVIPGRVSSLKFWMH